MQTATQQFDRTFHQACLLLVLFCYVMPVWEGSNAYADPPPWAPAHGYRHKHHQGDEHDDDQDEEDGNQDRQREVYAVPYGIDRGTCNREELGRVLGGVAGAAVGSNVGQGNGRTAAVIAGTIIGAIIGGDMGRSMDRVDQGCIGQALEYAPDGRVVNWSDSNLGARYQVTPTQTFHDRQNRNCRKYETDVIRDGANHKVYGTACRDIDGSWRAGK